MELESNNHLWKKIINKSIRQYIFFLLIAPWWYIIKLLLTNALSVSDIWLLYWIINLIGLISIYNDFWLSDCLQYFIPQYAIKKNGKSIFSLISFTFFFQFITGIVIIALLYFSSDRIAIHYFNSPIAAELLRIFCWYFLFLNILQVTTNLFVAYQHPIYQNITEILRMGTVIALIIYFARYDTVDITASAYAWIIGSLVAMCAAFIIFFMKYSSVYKWYTIQRKIIDIKTRFNYAIRAFVGANITMLYWQIDQLLIVWLWWIESAWYYTAYQTLLSIFTTVMVPLTTLIYPIMAQLIVESDSNRLHYFLKLLYKYFFICWLIFAIIFSIFWQQTAIILFWEKFAFSGKLMQWWAILQLLWWINRVTLLFYAARGSVKERVHLVGIWLIINICSIVLFYPLLWVYSAIGWLWLSILYIFLRSQYVLKNKRWYRWLLDMWFIFKNLSAWILIFAIFFFTSSYISFSTSRIIWWLELIWWSAIILLFFSYINISYIKEAKNIFLQK